MCRLSVALDHRLRLIYYCRFHQRLYLTGVNIYVYNIDINNLNNPPEADKKNMKKTKARQKGGQAKKCSEDMIKEKIHDVADDLSKMIKKAKSSYDKADPETKKKVLAGIAGAGALLTSVLGARALKKKKKK